MKSNKVKYNIQLKVFGAGIIGMLLFSCVDPDRPYSEEMKHDELGVQFMDDMYPSRAYETYGENANFSNNMASREPAEGSIPRGYLPYPYPNTPEGYAMAGDSLKSPIILNEDPLKDFQVIVKGKDLYGKFCVHCHGETGNGDGLVVTHGNFPPPPSYSTGASSGGGDMKDLPEGKMFHSITYGRNLMGSHASQLSHEERWKIIHYVQTLQRVGNQDDNLEEGEEVNNGTEDNEN
jgi:mono/diheme cytochrome c family protein